MTVFSANSPETIIMLDGDRYMGSIPNNINIATDGYLRFGVCANCGYMTGTWPLPQNILRDDEDIDIDEEIRQALEDEDMGDGTSIQDYDSTSEGTRVTTENNIIVVEDHYINPTNIVGLEDYIYLTERPLIDESMYEGNGIDSNFDQIVGVGGYGNQQDIRTETFNIFSPDNNTELPETFNISSPDNNRELPETIKWSDCLDRLPRHLDDVSDIIDFSDTITSAPVATPVSDVRNIADTLGIEAGRAHIISQMRNSVVSEVSSTRSLSSIRASLSERLNASVADISLNPLILSDPFHDIPSQLQNNSPVNSLLTVTQSNTSVVGELPRITPMNNSNQSERNSIIPKVTV